MASNFKVSSEKYVGFFGKHPSMSSDVRNEPTRWPGDCDKFKNDTTFQHYRGIVSMEKSFFYPYKK